MHDIPISKLDQGKIYLEGERIVLTSTSVFGTLWKDLAENIGSDRLKGFLLRYGWNLGAADAKRVLSHSPCEIEAALRQGTRMHMEKGFTIAETTHFQIQYDKSGEVESVYVRGRWIDSYEAEEHLREYGPSSDPVCHTLTGYASGYYSTICGKKIIFKEEACQGAGHSECHYVGKTIFEWEGEAEEELQFYDDQTIVDELKKTNGQLLEERNNLATAAAVHEKIMKEMTKGSDLHSIVQVVHNMIEIPIIIQDVHLRMMASAGLTKELFEDSMPDTFPSIHKTVELELVDRKILITPIFLNEKIYGYCSFIYESSEYGRAMDKMILERVATVCSLYIMQDKSIYEAQERVKGHLLDQILMGQFPSKEEILTRGSYLHLNLSLPYYIVVIKKAVRKKSYGDDLLLYEKVIEDIFYYFKDHPAGVLIGHDDGNVVLMLQTESTKKDGGIKSFCEKLSNYLRDTNPLAVDRIGISTEGSKIERAQQYYKEALTALKIGVLGKTITAFDELGITGILIHSQNKEVVKQKARHLLGPVLESDKIKNTELIQTMYNFLINGGNLEKTMDDLSISMSGLRYRIEKIESMLGKNLRDPEVSYEILFILKALIVMGEISF